MLVRILKILFIFIAFLYHSSTFSKSTESKNFNQRYLSNYFSALVSHENGDNQLTIKYFNSTKSILKDYPNYFDQYVNSLVLDNKVRDAINQIKLFDSKNKDNNFQANLLLTIDALKNNKFNKVNNYLSDMEKVLIPNSYEEIIYQILKSYNQLFLNKTIYKIKNYGKLSKILLAFQYCYLDDEKANNYFVRSFKFRRWRLFKIFIFLYFKFN